MTQQSVFTPPSRPGAPPQPLIALLTAKQLAKLLGVTVRTVWRWEEEGRCPRGVRLTRNTVRWHAGQVQEFIDRQRTAEPVAQTPEPRNGKPRHATAFNGRHS